jgi:hypothetical protein
VRIFVGRLARMRRAGAVIEGARPAAAATAAAPTTAATAHGKLYAAPERSGIFFVEHIECRQTDAGDFLLTESDFVTHSGVPRRHIRSQPTYCCPCTVH